MSSLVQLKCLCFSVTYHTPMQSMKSMKAAQKHSQKCAKKPAQKLALKPAMWTRPAPVKKIAKKPVQVKILRRVAPPVRARRFFGGLDKKNATFPVLHTQRRDSTQRARIGQLT